MKTKVLFLTSGLSAVGNSGGISSYVDDLATSLQSKGYGVHVYLFSEVCPPKSFAGDYKFSFFQIPERRAHEHLLVKELWASINTLNPAIIINNDISYMAGLWPVIDCEIIRISIAHAFSSGRSMNITGIMGKIATYNWEYIDYIVCQNEGMTKDMVDKYKVSPSRIVCIHQTVPYRFIEKAKGETFNIIFAGGENRSKGAAEMFQVSRKLQETNLNFLVTWCLPAKKYEDAFNGDKRFKFTGNMPREKFLQALNNSDCIIIPTHADTGPLILIEAMALGVIPICNNIKSAIPDIIINNENGFLVDNNLPDSYVAIISDLIYGTKSISPAALSEYFLENLSTKIQIEKFEAIFHKNGKALSPKKFTDENIVLFHKRNMANKGLQSLNKIFNKIMSYYEIVLTHDKYVKWFKLIK